MAIVFEILWFLLLPYNKSIIQIQLQYNNAVIPKSLIGLILNSALIVLFIIFLKGKVNFYIDKTNIIKFYAICILTKLVFDVVGFALSFLFTRFCFPIEFLLFGVYCFLLIKLAIKHFNIITIRISKQKMIMLIILLCLLVVVLFAYGFNNMMHFKGKINIYNENVLMNMASSFEFKLNVIKALFVIIFESICLLSLKTDSDKKVKFVQVFSRFLVIPVIGFVFYIIVCLICPFNVIANFDADTQMSTRYIDGNPALESKKTELNLYQKNGYKNEELFYSGRKIKISYKGVKKYSQELYSDNYKQSIYQSGVVGGGYYCPRIAVMYIENDKLKVYDSKRIKKLSTENIRLTKILEETISNGDVDLFVDSLDYMMKYDKDFIKPYIIKYANQLVDDVSIYNTEYVNSFCKERLSNSKSKK